jgi:hypothetical protein
MPNPECQFLTNTGGCANCEKAGDNAVATPAIINQPQSCRFAISPWHQPHCDGYKPKQLAPAIETTPKTK